MDKKRILDETKHGMTQAIERLDIINVDEIKKILIRYLEFVEMLQKLPEFESRIEHAATEQVAVATEETIENSPVENEEAIEVIRERKLYTVERKLKGGLLPEFKDGYMIPETIMRKLGIEHGDKIEVIDTNQNGEGGEFRYRFAIAEKGNGDPHPDRVEELYCLVEKDSLLGYIVRQDYLGNALYIGDNPYTFILKQNDVNDLHIQENDLVDIAYYRNSPTSVRIVWKHDTTEIEEATKIRRQKKVESKTSTRKESCVENPKLFEGKKVLVIGGKPKEANYRDVLEALGASVEVFAGTETKARTRGAIQRSDAVMMVTAYMGHGKSSGSNVVVEMCKKVGRVFGIVDNMGNESFLRSVEKVLLELNRQEELVDGLF